MEVHSFAGAIAVGSGAFVGFSLALTGGGGSTLAVPLLLYLVGLHNVHLAIGTSALAVAANAYTGLVPHARAGHVHWKSGLLITITGVAGAFLGSEIGKLVSGRNLIVLFAVLMILVALLMLRPSHLKRPVSDAAYPLHLAPRLLGAGFGVGSISGFFGIGGGFLIVPSLVFAARMDLVHAIGTSLVATGSFALTTALNYARSNLIDWTVAGEFIAGGVVGGWLGASTARRLSKKHGLLNAIFSAVIIIAAVYMLVQR